MSVQTFALTNDCGVSRNIKNAAVSMEINDQGSDVLVSEPVNTSYAKRSRGKTNTTAGVVNFGLPNAKSIVGK